MHCFRGTYISSKTTKESKDTINTQLTQSCSLRDQDDAHKAQQQLWRYSGFCAGGESLGVYLIVEIHREYTYKWNVCIKLVYAHLKKWRRRNTHIFQAGKSREWLSVCILYLLGCLSVLFIDTTLKKKMSK